MNNHEGVNVPRDTETILFQRVDNLDGRVLVVEREQYSLIARIAATEKSGDDVCKQLNKTDARLTIGLELVAKGQAEIKSQLDRQEGAKGAYKLVPILLGVAVMALQLLQLIKK